MLSNAGATRMIIRITLTCSLGWNDFMSVAAFTEPEAGYLCNDVATFSASFHIIKESSNFNRSIERALVPRGRNNRAKGGSSKTPPLFRKHWQEASLRFSQRFQQQLCHMSSTRRA